MLAPALIFGDGLSRQQNGLVPRRRTDGSTAFNRSRVTGFGRALATSIAIAATIRSAIPSITTAPTATAASAPASALPALRLAALHSFTGLRRLRLNLALTFCAFMAAIAGLVATGLRKPTIVAAAIEVPAIEVPAVEGVESVGLAAAPVACAVPSE